MKISSAFPSNYLKASDLNGQSKTFTMTEVRIEAVGMDKEQRPVLYFRESTKGMVLNKVNSKKISDLYGDDTHGWNGREVSLYEAMVDFQGDTVPAIRVRAATMQNAPRRQETAQTSYQAEPVPQSAFKDLNIQVGSSLGSLLTEAEGMAHSGIENFRGWRDQLGAKEFDALKPHMDRLLTAANQASPPVLSERAKKSTKL